LIGPQLHLVHKQPAHDRVLKYELATQTLSVFAESITGVTLPVASGYLAR
jgi:hypothetical protein